MFFTFDMVAYALLIFAIAFNLIHFGIVAYVALKMNKKPDCDSVESGKIYSGVSILKPCKGADANLKMNLESFFNLSYPKYEIIFCVHDYADPAVEVMKRLIQKYPNIPARISTSRKDDELILNPKISNMMSGYNEMKYELFWISDARVFVHPDTLDEMVMTLSEDVAVVHAVPFVKYRPGFAASVEQVFFGTNQTIQYLCAQFLGITCFSGASNLGRKCVVDTELNGLNGLSEYIAEDYYMGKLLQESGWKCKVSSYPALQNLGEPTISTFTTRLIRWKKLQIALAPLAVILEPFMEWSVIALALAIACKYFFNWSILIVFIYQCVVWAVTDYLLLKLISRGKIGTSVCEYIGAWFLRALMVPYVSLCALRNPYIYWMGKKYKISWGGTVHKVINI